MKRLPRKLKDCWDATEELSRDDKNQAGFIAPVGKAMRKVENLLECLTIVENRDIRDWSNTSEKGQGHSQPKGKGKGKGKGKRKHPRKGYHNRTRLDLQMKMDSARWVILV